MTLVTLLACPPKGSSVTSLVLDRLHHTPPHRPAPARRHTVPRRAQGRAQGPPQGHHPDHTPQKPDARCDAPPPRATKLADPRAHIHVHTAPEMRRAPPVLGEAQTAVGLGASSAAFF